MLDMSKLVDMLDVETTRFLKLSVESGNEVKYAKCVLTIKALQTEIANRKLRSRNSGEQDPSSDSLISAR